MRFSSFAWAVGAAAALAACQSFDKPTLMVAEGTLYDKYTRKPLANVPVVARRFVYGSYGNTSVDSVARALTDAAGHYRLDFSALSNNPYGRGHYRFKPDLYRRSLYDLTAYSDYYSYADGVEVQPGSSTVHDFQLVPLIPTRVLITNLSKQGRQAVNVYLQADEQDGQGYFSTLQIITDTTRVNQQVSTSKLVYTVPYRTYILTAYRSSVVCPTPTQCQAANVSYEQFRRTVAYPDTAVIRLP